MQKCPHFDGLKLKLVLTKTAIQAFTHSRFLSFLSGGFLSLCQCTEGESNQQKTGAVSQLTAFAVITHHMCEIVCLRGLTGSLQGYNTPERKRSH